MRESGRVCNLFIFSPPYSNQLHLNNILKSHKKLIDYCSYNLMVREPNIFYLNFQRRGVRLLRIGGREISRLHPEGGCCSKTAFLGSNPGNPARHHSEPGFAKAKNEAASRVPNGTRATTLILDCQGNIFEDRPHGRYFLGFSGRI